MENYPYLSEAVARILLHLRKNAGLSQQKLADMSSIARIYLLQLEQGKFRPTLNSIFFLARGLDIPPQKFVEMIETERQKLATAAIVDE